MAKRCNMLVCDVDKSPLNVNELSEFIKEKANKDTNIVIKLGAEKDETEKDKIRSSSTLVLAFDAKNNNIIIQNFL